MTAPATIKATEIKGIAQAMRAEGYEHWAVEIELTDGRKMTVSVGSPPVEDGDQFDSVVYPTK
jgi:hypothetical protein